MCAWLATTYIFMQRRRKSNDRTRVPRFNASLNKGEAIRWRVPTIIIPSLMEDYYPRL